MLHTLQVGSGSVPAGEQHAGETFPVPWEQL